MRKYPAHSASPAESYDERSMELQSTERSSPKPPEIRQRVDLPPSRPTAQTVPTHSRYEQTWLKHQLEERPDRATEAEDARSALGPNGVPREIGTSARLVHH